MKSLTPQRTLGWVLLTIWMACCIGLLSCRKSPDRKVIVRGKVIEYGTGAPVVDARIYVLCYDGAIFGSPSSSLADSILTDSDGRFYREYEDSELCNGVYLLPYKESYFKGGEIDLTTNNEEHEVVLDPEAWLKVITIPDVSENVIWFRGTFTGASGWNAYKSKGIQEFFFATKGNENKTISWGNYDQPEAIGRDTFYMTGHDTATYTIHY